LTGAEARHAVVVKRLRPGEEIMLSDGVGSLALGTVEAATTRPAPRVEVRVRGVVHVSPRSPELVLVQALAKGRRDEQAVAAATALGVDRLIPWLADRSSARSNLRWEELVRAEAKVARRALIPKVESALDSGALTERLGGAVREAGARVIVLHEESTTPLAEALGGAEASGVFLVVGPEGSISPEELAAFEAVGARTARLGPEVLRTALAGAAGLALASYLLGRWS
jgi:16S rRNA (uracil1498-N3)-methyltransferase